MDTYAKIRKLRKKLRQIEHLEEIERDLTDEEVSKCMRKDQIREELLHLLQSYNANSAAPMYESDFDSTLSTLASSTSTSDVGNVSMVSAMLDQDIVTESDIHIVTEKECVEAVSGTDNKNSNNKSTQEHTNKGHLSASHENIQSSNLQPASANKDDFRKSKEPAISAKKTQSEKGDQRCKVDPWRKAEFIVSSLEGHNDLVTAVDICDNLCVSASRDTTVKIWDVEKMVELRSLGGHTGSVTDVIILPYKDIADIAESLGLAESDYLILSASSDCSLKIWSADTGDMLTSIYTYNPITKIGYCQHTGKPLVAVASDGGKLELWDIVEKENVCSERAHSESVTGLSVSGKLVTTSCAVEGEIKVFEIRDLKLHCIFVSENVKDLSGHLLHMRHVRCLAVKGDNLFYGDDGVNLKVLAWKTALVKKLNNHKEEFGMTDAICCHGDLMLTSAYDLDNGQGYINVFNITTDAAYLATLHNSDTGRIFDIACAQHKGLVTIVTAGIDLQIWVQVKSGSTQKEANSDIIQAKFLSQLSQPAEDSDLESDVDFSESDGESVSNSQSSSRRNSSQATSWKSWCSLV